MAFVSKKIITKHVFYASGPISNCVSYDQLQASSTEQFLGDIIHILLCILKVNKIQHIQFVWQTNWQKN